MFIKGESVKCVQIITSMKSKRMYIVMRSREKDRLSEETGKYSVMKNKNI